MADCFILCTSVSSSSPNQRLHTNHFANKLVDGRILSSHCHLQAVISRQPSICCKANYLATLPPKKIIEVTEVTSPPLQTYNTWGFVYKWSFMESMMPYCPNSLRQWKSCVPPLYTVLSSLPSLLPLKLPPKTIQHLCHLKCCIMPIASFILIKIPCGCHNCYHEPLPHNSQ